MRCQRKPPTDFTSRQYFQAANQVQLTNQLETSFETKNHKNTDFVFGILTGYPCRTANMHQSWPKFVQNLFYGSDDGGVAAIQYAPSTVKLKVADSVDVTIKETTGFPFRETVNFELQLSSPATFPFHFRIPAWTDNPKITINGEKVSITPEKGVAIVRREWKDGDRIELTLPMTVKATQWHAGATAIDRGPLVYAFGIAGDYRKKNRNDGYGEFTEIYPKEAWNYGLLASEIDDLSSSVEVIKKDWNGSYPWNLENAPIHLKIKGVQIPDWKLVKSAPVFPDSEKLNLSADAIAKELTLVPYGCTTLRITEFPKVSQ